jgi:hypothetical protein
MQTEKSSAAFARLAAAFAMITAAAFVPAAGAQQTGGSNDDTGNASSDVLAARRGTLTYSGQTLFRIRTGGGGYSAEQRAEAVRERMVPILSLENLRPEEITVRQTRKYQDATIYVRDRLLITIDQEMARSNGNNDPGALAQQWAERMRRILPTVSVKQSRDIPASRS